MVQVPLIELPKPWLFFSAIMTVSLAYLVYALVRKRRGWMRGIPDEPAQGHDRRRTIVIWVSEVLLQRQLYGLSRIRWFVHLLIFYGFVGLILLYPIEIVLLASGLLAVTNTGARFYRDPIGYMIMKAWGDFFGLMLLAGLVLAGSRRLLVRQEQQKNDQADLILLAFLVLITATGFFLEGLRLAVLPGDVAKYSFVGQAFVPSGISLSQIQAVYTVSWAIHAILVASLIAYLPHSKLMHSLLAPIVIGLNATSEQARTDLYWPDVNKYKPTR